MTVPIRVGTPQQGRISLDIAGEGSRRPGGLGAEPQGASFANTLDKALGNVQQSQDGAAEMVQRYARGENVELHQVMAATEEASISLQMLVEIRNKFTDAYKTVIQMQG
jgi:flagellar hook-basal body complex protein FliE